jgi:hypothetical protein
VEKRPSKRGRATGEERGEGWSVVRGVKNIFAEVHFFLACRSDSCILQKRVRFTATPRAKIV